MDYYHFEREHLQDQREQLIAQQSEVLHQHFDLAQELDLPVIIHCRDAAIHHSGRLQAFEDLLKLLESYNGNVRGVVHCYTGTPEYIDRFIEMGLYIGFTGIVTFPNASEVQAAVIKVPMNRLLLETDAPYLTPAPHRGKRNEPAYVQYVAQ